MLGKLKSIIARRPAPSVRSFWFGLLRLAPWIVFGPITGVMSEAAVAAFKSRRPVLGGVYVLLNVGILIAMPTLTAAILAYSAARRGLIPG
jgi:hypothetical protein